MRYANKQFSKNISQDNLNNDVTGSRGTKQLFSIVPSLLYYMSSHAYSTY